MKVFKKGLAGILTYVLARKLGFEQGPYLVTFIPTLRCNARCRACDIWKMGHDGDEMTLSEIRAVFDQMSDLRVVKITGGEPFLRKDLSDIIDYLLNERGLMVQITTNGLLTDRILDTVGRTANPRLHLNVSLDGVGEFVNTMRGIPDYFDTVLGTLKKLVEIRKEKKFFLAVNQTMFFGDKTQWPTLKPVLKKIGITNIHYGIENNLFDSEASETDKKNYWRTISRDDFLKLREVVERYHLTSFIRDIAYKYYFKGLENRVLNKLEKPKFKCTALNTYFRLFPNGDVLTCSVIAKPVTNVRNEDFNAVWKSPEMERARKTVSNCEGCWFGCEAIPNATVNLDILEAIFY
ncbi:MAG: radical SAM protein [Candidatus Latescibacteria bacterium]|nr:radical SAM protein [Candidatus Latescibacterota bacterium]